MLRGAVARRYAQALYEIAVDNNALDAIEEELRSVSTVVEGERDIQKILYHPQIVTAEKREVLKQLFEGRVSETTMNFLYLLMDRHRESYLGEIVKEYIQLANTARNMVDAQVVSARELTEEQKQELAGVLNRLAGKEVSPDYKVDTSLIGGLLVRIGDKVIDGSVKYRLETLRQRLMSQTS